MRENLEPAIHEELEYFIKKFIEGGWVREDEACISKEVDFTVNPAAKEDLWKHTISLVLFPELLFYQHDDGASVLIPWIACRYTGKVDTAVKNMADSPFWCGVADWLRAEISRIGLKTFRDETAWKNIFSHVRVDDQGWGEFKFYLNMGYADGYSCNHTL